MNLPELFFNILTMVNLIIITLNSENNPELRNNHYAKLIDIFSLTGVFIEAVTKNIFCIEKIGNLNAPFLGNTSFVRPETYFQVSFVIVIKPYLKCPAMIPFTFIFTVSSLKEEVHGVFVYPRQSLSSDQ
jgi:hypothetical protein